MPEAPKPKMPKAIFTTKNRAELRIASILSDAVLVSSDDEQDVFDARGCRITCRYWVRGGDFVSKQILGCGTAVRSGQLKCVDAETVEKQVYETQSVLGVVGPEDAVQSVVQQIAEKCGGVIVDGDKAVLA